MSYKYRFIILNTGINYMFDFINALESYYGISFRVRNEFPNTIINNRFVFLYHDIIPQLLLSNFLIGVRFRIIDMTHLCNIS